MDTPTDVNEACQGCLNGVDHWSQPNCLPNRWNALCVENGCRLFGGHSCKQAIFKNEPQYQNEKPQDAL
jgi:hypothetical protein